MSTGWHSILDVPSLEICGMVMARFTSVFHAWTSTATTTRITSSGPVRMHAKPLYYRKP